MKRAVLILVILSLFQSCGKQQEEKKDDDKTAVIIDYSGEYSGTFSDLKNTEGKIKLSLYQSNNGITGGIIIIQKNNSKEKLITGTINVMGDGKTINGNFIPSVVDHSVLYPDTNKNLVPVDSYQCSWNFYGEIKDEFGNLIIGKAVPMGCSESNLMEFILEREK